MPFYEYIQLKYHGVFNLNLKFETAYIKYIAKKDLKKVKGTAEYCHRYTISRLNRAKVCHNYYNEV